MTVTTHLFANFTLIDAGLFRNFWLLVASKDLFRNRVLLRDGTNQVLKRLVRQRTEWSHPTPFR
jgi:hypothetical protein